VRQFFLPCFLMDCVVVSNVQRRSEATPVFCNREALCRGRGQLSHERARDWIANGDKAALSVLEATPTSEGFFRRSDRRGFRRGDKHGGLVFAELNLRRCIEPKRFYDVAAGYNRFDLFDFRVHRERLRPVRFGDVAKEAA
jgi:nitrilase